LTEQPLPARRDMESLCARGPLIDAISAFLAHRYASGLNEIRTSLDEMADFRIQNSD
jgi:hypothetical protein